MAVSSDFRDLLSVFNANQVRYLVIGGYAVVRYTEPRYTKDLDIWISVDPENAVAVFRALRAFGAPLTGMTERDFSEEGFFYQMGVPPVRIDILTEITGLSFDVAWKNRVPGTFFGVPVNFISQADLETNKRALGHASDVRDLKRAPGKRILKKGQ